MQYVLLLYGNESEAAPAELDRATLGLAPTASATTVRLRGGRTLLSDGPYAETRDQLLGLQLVEAKDLDEAIALAEQVPAARSGSVEIRPVRAAS